jgi:hypothetical protein
MSTCIALVQSHFAVCRFVVERKAKLENPARREMVAA